MKEYIKHIANTMKGLTKTSKTLCGEETQGMWCFVSIDHAFYNNLADGRLLPCKKCVKKVLKVLV